ncbi:amidoligase family protein [Vibrio sp. FJH11]
MAFKTLPLTATEDQEVRRVGFEIEFTSLTIGDATQILQKVFGGELEQKSAVEYVLHTPEYGKSSLSGIDEIRRFPDSSIPI